MNAMTNLKLVSEKLDQAAMEAKEQRHFGASTDCKKLSEVMSEVGEKALFKRIAGCNCVDGIDSLELANMVILGLRHLAMGGEPFDPAKPRGEIYWTAKRLIARQTEEMNKATGPLRNLYDGRAQGMIMAFFNAGLIDNETYMSSFKALLENEVAK